MAAVRLGNKVRSLRRRDGMTQTQLAAQLEISPSYLNLSSITSGRCRRICW